MNSKGLLILISLMLIFSCKNVKSIIDPNDNGESWSMKNYTYEQRINCFCGEPANEFHEITVKNDSIVKAIKLFSKKAIEPDNFRFFKTIPELFEFLESINADSVATLNVEYDKNHKYPSLIWVDYYEFMADEEIGYETRNFRPL